MLWQITVCFLNKFLVLRSPLKEVHTTSLGEVGGAMERKETRHHFGTAAKCNCCFCVWRKIMPTLYYQ